MPEVERFLFAPEPAKFYKPLPVVAQWLAAMEARKARGFGYWPCITAKGEVGPDIWRK